MELSRALRKYPKLSPATRSSPKLSKSCPRLREALRSSLELSGNIRRSLHTLLNVEHRHTKKNSWAHRTLTKLTHLANERLLCACFRGRSRLVLGHEAGQEVP
eukprot:1495986-Alexandrium_andersonii.AAC.1